MKVGDWLDELKFGGDIRGRYETFFGRQTIIQQDDEVDQLNRQLHRELTSFMIENPKTITRVLNLMSVAHNLERIADYASNIAEEIVYLYEAHDIRHSHVR